MKDWTPPSKTEFNQQTAFGFELHLFPWISRPLAYCIGFLDAPGLQSCMNQFLKTFLSVSLDRQTDRQIDWYKISTYLFLYMSVLFWRTLTDDSIYIDFFPPLNIWIFLNCIHDSTMSIVHHFLSFFPLPNHELAINSQYFHLRFTCVSYILVHFINKPKLFVIVFILWFFYFFKCV